MAPLAATPSSFLRFFLKKLISHDGSDLEQPVRVCWGVEAVKTMNKECQLLSQCIEQFICFYVSLCFNGKEAQAPLPANMIYC